MEQQKQLQALSDDYQSLQTGLYASSSHCIESPLTLKLELSTLVTARQKLESQQQENKSVQAEFSTLDDDANIYKLVGPVLLKQDTAEAKSTVDGRLEYIGQEMSVSSIFHIISSLRHC